MISQRFETKISLFIARPYLHKIAKFHLNTYTDGYFVEFITLVVGYPLYFNV